MALFGAITVRGQITDHTRRPRTFVRQIVDASRLERLSLPSPLSNYIQTCSFFHCTFFFKTVLSTRRRDKKCSWWASLFALWAWSFQAQFKYCFLSVYKGVSKSVGKHLLYTCCVRLAFYRASGPTRAVGASASPDESKEPKEGRKTPFGSRLLPLKLQIFCGDIFFEC